MRVCFLPVSALYLAGPGVVSVFTFFTILFPSIFVCRASPCSMLYLLFSERTLAHTLLEIHISSSCVLCSCHFLFISKTLHTIIFIFAIHWLKSRTPIVILDIRTAVVSSNSYSNQLTKHKHKLSRF